MQNLILLLFIYFAVYFSACAQKRPPTAIIAAYCQKFQNAKELERIKEKNGEWEARFEHEHSDKSANFSAKGKWINTVTQIKIADLLSTVQVFLTGNQVKEATKVFRAYGSMVCKAEVKYKEIINAANDKLLSQCKD